MRTKPEKFEKNITNMIGLARKFSSRNIFLGLMPVDEKKTTPIPWRKDISYKNEYIEKYNEIIKNVCRENKIGFIDIFDKFLKNNYKKLLDDGLHPNSKGHEKIFGIVKNFIYDKKIL